MSANWTWTAALLHGTKTVPSWPKKSVLDVVVTGIVAMGRTAEIASPIAPAKTTKRVWTTNVPLFAAMVFVKGWAEKIV